MKINDYSIYHWSFQFAVFCELNPSLLGFQDGTIYAVHATYIQWPSQGVISQSFHVNLPLPDSLLT